VHAQIDTLAALTALERLDLDGAGVTRPVDAGAVMAPLQMGPGNDDDLAGRPDCAAAFVRRLGRLLPALGRLRALRVRGGPARYGAGYDSRSDEFLATDAAIEVRCHKTLGVWRCASPCRYVEVGLRITAFSALGKDCV